MSQTIVTGVVRFSFVSVFTPKVALDGGQAKYQITLLIPKSDTKTITGINNAIQQTIQEALGTTFGGQPPMASRLPLYDGDGLRPGGEPFGPECKGHWVMSAKTMQKPEVVDANVQPIIDPNSVYSGCYGRVSLRFYAYNKNGNKGIGCNLGNVQKLSDGEPLGGRTSATSDFANPVSDFTPASVQVPYQPATPEIQQQTHPQPSYSQQSYNPLGY